MLAAHTSTLDSHYLRSRSYNCNKAHSEHCTELLSPHSWISRILCTRPLLLFCMYITLYNLNVARPHRDPPEYAMPIACIIKRAKIARVLTLYFKVYVEIKVLCTVCAITRSAAKTTKNVLIFRDQSVHVPYICTVSSTSLQCVVPSLCFAPNAVVGLQYTILYVKVCNNMFIRIDLKSI